MNQKNYIIAMDQGTTSSRCIIFDREGTVRSLAQKEYPQIYPKPGWVEHDPMQILGSQTEVTHRAMEQLGVSAEEIAAIGITNQRETTIVWDAETGLPVYNGICWQCRRTADLIARLVKEGLGDMVHSKTGLIPDAYFSAGKIAWILQNVPGAAERARRGELRFGTVDSWLIWNLTGGRVHATDYTNASRTMLFDIHRLCWDRELLDWFQIPESMLPKVQPSGSLFGMTGQFGGDIPITGAAGDQQAALFGQCAFAPGDVKHTYGTGGFMLMNTGKDAVHTDTGLLTTIAASADGQVQYALEGSVFIAGAVIQWLRDEMHLLERSSDCEEFCRQVEDTAGVYIVPAFSGLGAPCWQSDARGTVVGLTRGASKAHFIRAAVESMAYQTDDLLQAMRRASELAIHTLKADGGACANNFLLQFQSDLSGIDIQRPGCIETTALGAAYLAGLTSGFWDSTKQLVRNHKCEHLFRPEMSEEQRSCLKKGWKRAIRCAVAWAEKQEEE